MQRVQRFWIVSAAIISTTLLLAAPAMAGENKFVFVPRTDSPGNDYSRVDNSSFEDCAQKCDAQSECNAFTYNQLHIVCFLKLSANRAAAFYAFGIAGIKLSPSVQPTAGASGSGPSFVMLPQADSPGNDYSRIEHFSLEECRSSCETDDGCNAFTYNSARGVCFLKRAANQWTNFSAWAITGLKLSSQPKEKTANTLPVNSEPPEQAKAPQPSTAVTTAPPEQEKAPQPSAAVTTAPSEQEKASQPSEIAPPEADKNSKLPPGESTH
jgi:hypothetical protein